MAKASVATLFRAFLLADRARDSLVRRMGYSREQDATLSESGMNYGQALLASSRLDDILQRCDIEVEIPPESPQFIERLIEISQ